MASMLCLSVFVDFDIALAFDDLSKEVKVGAFLLDLEQTY